MKAQWMAAIMLAWLGVAARADYINATIDGSFSEWAAVPNIATDPADNSGSIDFLTLKVANNENFLFIYYSLNESVNPQGGGGVYLAIDEDNNVGTGFDPFALGVVGSEASWQNDFPFEQSTGNFNTGNGLSGATYLASPYNGPTTEVEISIPRTATHTVGGANIIPADGQSIRVGMWTEEGADDILGGTYTLSVVPEPASVGLFGIGALTLLAARLRRKR